MFYVREKVPLPSLYTCLHAQDKQSSRYVCTADLPTSMNRGKVSPRFKPFLILLTGQNISPQKSGAYRLCILKTSNERIFTDLKLGKFIYELSVASHAVRSETITVGISINCLFPVSR